MTPAQFLKLRNRVDSIEGANLPAATSGAHLIYEDTPPFHTTDGRPVRLNYAVVNEATTAKSDVSNIATIVPLEVPAAPAQVAATTKPEGVVLTWEAPSTSKLFNIYRAGANEAPNELAPPVNTAPVKGSSYNDVPPYGTYTYRVTAVASPGPPVQAQAKRGGFMNTGVELTLGGFVEGATIYRSRNLTADIGSPWNTIPFPNSPNYHLSEFRFTGRQTRLSRSRE